VDGWEVGKLRDKALSNGVEEWAGIRYAGAATGECGGVQELTLWEWRWLISVCGRNMFWLSK
jgi:hypothetical protein